MKNNWLMWMIVLIVVLGVGYAGYKYLKKSGGYGAMVPSRTMTYVYVTPTAAALSSGPMGTSPSTVIVKTITSSTLGTYATDPKGMTLYVFSKDSTGVSNCNDGCRTTWPPYPAVSTSTGGTLQANVSLVKRSDGTSQYAWAGKPLYYYAGDKAPGDSNGQGIGGVWFVAKP